MIDGCNPIQTFFLIVLPILKPTMVSVGILEAMWVWNDYLLPSLVLNINKYKTIPIAIQFLKQSHGQIDWGGHDGSTCSFASANYYLLYCVPEIYNRRSSCRCCQGLENRPFVCIYEVKE